MNFGLFATWVLVGLATGWLAGVVMKHGGHGRLWDLILGLIGSSAASALVAALGVLPDAGPQAAEFVTAACAFAGAVIVIVAQRKVWYAHA